MRTALSIGKNGRNAMWHYCVLLALTIISNNALAQISITLTKEDPTCNGYTNGSVSAAVSGGTAPYVYRWSTGATGTNIIGLGRGTYSLTVTDAANRTQTGSITLTDPSPVNVNVSFANICTGGAVTATATGGTAPYTYNWGGGRTGATQNGLAAGGYNLTVTDSKGCSIARFVLVPGALSVNLRIGELLCFGDCDAAIDALPQGGTAPFTYRWNTGATTQSIVGIPSGTYSVVVTDANGCTFSTSGTVLNPPQIVLNTTVNSPACGGGASGSATVTATGGKAPYTYLWSTGQTTATATGLNVGSYNVTVTDANRCAKVATVQVRSSANFNVLITKTDAGCGVNNGSATATVTGGTGPFTYRWNTGATTATINNLGAGTYTVTVTDASGCANVASTVVNATGNLTISVAKTDATCGIANGTATVSVITGTAPYTYRWSGLTATTPSVNLLSAGTYTVTVTDASGCTAIQSVTILQSNSFDLNIDKRDVTCFGGSNGQASAMVMGGSAPYTYRWSNGGTVATIANLTAGTYTVTVTDASGCVGTRSVTINQPTAIAATLTATGTTCGNSNGSVTTTVSGGTAPYTYLWSNGATTASISNVAGGSYSVTITDANGCTLTQSAAVGSSTAVSVALTSTNVICFTLGSAGVTASGGTAPYTYAWSNGQTTASISGLTAGTYTVTVTDARGCTRSGSVTITGTLSNLACNVLIANQISEDGGSDGALSTNVTGGVAPYSYRWNTGATTLALGFIRAGTYTVTVTDAQGCQTVCSQTLVNPPCSNVVNPGVICCDQTFCNPNELVNIRETTPASGGNGAIEYMWMYSTLTPVFDATSWQNVPNSNTKDLDLSLLPTITRTTYIIRCIRRVGCEQFKESNVVTLRSKVNMGISGPIQICLGQNSTFEAPDNGPGASYVWSFTGSTPLFANTRVVTNKFNLAGRQTVRLQIVNQGCSREITTTVDVINCAGTGGNITAFTVAPNNPKEVSVRWATENEAISSVYCVERSSDGVEYREIARVASQNGNRNIYQFADVEPKMGRSFYRIKQIDQNGQEQISEIRQTVLFNGSVRTMAYPNPVDNKLYVEILDIPTTEGVVEVYTTTGLLVKAQKFTADQMRYEIDMNGLPQGNYIVKVKPTSGEARVLRVNKF